MFFSVIVLWMIIEGYYEETLVISLIMWAGNCLMFGWLNMFTTYDEEGFIHGVLPLIKKYYGYDEVTAIKKVGSSTYLVAGKKRILVDEMIMDCHYFLEVVKEKYKENHKTEIPVIVEKAPWDLFKGNIINGEGYLFAAVLGPIVCFIMLLYGVYVAVDLVTEEDTYYQEIVMDSYEVLDDRISMTKDKTVYYIFHCNAYGSTIDTLIEDLKNKIILCIYAVEHERRYNVITQYDVCAIKDAKCRQCWN